jgi:hypothetical protein
MASRSKGLLYFSEVYAQRTLSTGFLYGTRTVLGILRPSRIIAQ